MISGISDTALNPQKAAEESVLITKALIEKDFAELAAMKSA